LLPISQIDGDKSTNTLGPMWTINIHTTSDHYRRNFRAINTFNEIVGNKIIANRPQKVKSKLGPVLN
jgi:hypothetical protein